MVREDYTKRAYIEAKRLLNSISTKKGFVASAIDIDNYHRIFARDGVVALLASLLIGDENLIKTSKQTLITLADFQDKKTGRIVSNVSFDGKKVSYGTQVGRVDSNPWFVIGVGQYVKKTKDFIFAKRMYPYVKKTMDYLLAIELNGRGLLYIPYGGDWADEYLNHGYVLFDELLYLQAQRDFIYLSKVVKKPYYDYQKKSEFLEKQILVNFIPYLKLVDDEAFYQRSDGFEKLFLSFKKPHGIAYFVQGDIGDYFDSFANSLLLYLVALPEDFKKKFIRYFLKILDAQKIPIMPAFSPVIKKTHKEKDHHKWRILQFSYLFRQKNKPYHYHNGGLWPLVHGFFISALNFVGKNEKARELTDKFALILAEDKFRFSEYFDGKYGMPNGTEFLGFSASAYIIAYETSFNNKKLFL